MSLSGVSSSFQKPFWQLCLTVVQQESWKTNHAESNPQFLLTSYRLCTEGQRPLPLLNQWSYGIKVHFRLTSWSVLWALLVWQDHVIQEEKGNYTVSSGTFGMMLQRVFQPSAPSWPDSGSGKTDSPLPIYRHACLQAQPNSLPPQSTTSLFLLAASIKCTHLFLPQHHPESQG